MANPIWVYILKCSDGSYYTGTHVGEDPAERVDQHNSGSDPNAYTFSRRPVELLWAETFEEYTAGLAYEKRIKKWSRAKKEALMAGDWAEVSKLAKKTFT